MAVNLVFFSKSGRCKHISLDGGVTIVGRRPDCDIRIPLSYVSRKHCRFIRKEDQTLVQDLGSANGTFLNSERIMEATIGPGDKVGVGSITFTVQIDGQPAEIVPPKPPANAEKNETQPMESSSIAQANIGETATIQEESPFGGSGSNEEPLSDFDIDDFLNEPDKG